MAVLYGKLKRKYNARQQVLLSPTKHSVRQCDNELLSSSQNLFSFTTGSTETLKNSSMESTDSLFENNPSTTDLEDNPLEEQPSSPISKSQSNTSFDLYFKGFEELDKYDANLHKRQKNMHHRKKTTFFAKDGNLADCKKKNSKPNPLIDLSDDEFSSEISASLQTLNSRLFEIQSQVKSLSHEKSFFDSPEIQTSYAQDSNSADSGARHYGNTRSFRDGAESLSAAEEEEEEEEEEDIIEKNLSEKYPKVIKKSVNYKTKVRFADDSPYLLPSGKCQSLEELRRSGELESSKLEFDMIFEQLRKITHYGKKDFSELLQLKLNLLNKIESDTNFKNYLQRSVVGKENCTFNQTVKELLKVSPKDVIINFQLITFFRLTDWKGLDIVSAICKVSSMGDLFMKEYSDYHLKLPRKFPKELLGDWMTHCAKSSTYQITMKMLHSIGTSGTEDFTDEEKSVILDFCDLALQSSKAESLLLPLSVLRLNSSFLQGGKTNSLSTSLARLLISFPFQVDDPKVMNLILECSIIIVCDPEFSVDVSSNRTMFSNQIWYRLWEIVQTNNVLDKKDDLSDAKQNQCLIAIGYIFSFITFDKEVTASDLSPLNDFLAFADQKSKTASYNILQIHCIGYLGCISYHFFKRFHLLTDKNLSWIKNILKVHQSSELKSQEILSREIKLILREI
ncbi:hypothetical protein PICMEDRAFT_17520 [Pichia membranifaciens NRRL Y-2026]|uniref:Rad61 Wapl domain-containing protein n=1 Tax=Pichia membranifaciens NRRL Y-2026 TaxID=763406 RepID=A0A1E3NFV3_9ASCO|nr:hypothetical protein PICMEDRAFT_17520 [Pichia membranifaciens NRRL Y-2026]ODQ45017.1 hypothetical protein PICMEDRAFT_17520 [Pichia membranifaciens NRRL Y-2026]